MGAVDFSIDTKLVNALASVLPLDVFVETGTFEGEAIARLRSTFSEIYSAELSRDYYEKAVNRFDGDPTVNLYHGDSSDMLRHLQSQLRERSILYWLDAHWCVATNTEGEASQCPLLSELESIHSLNNLSAIIIDDARLFLAPPPAPHEAQDWPRFQSVVEGLKEIGPAHELMVVNDMIVFHPPTTLDAVTSYARSSGIDWLVQLHRLRELEAEHKTMTKALSERLDAINALTAEAEERGEVIAKLSEALSNQQ
jgi:hypothetical protein